MQELAFEAIVAAVVCWIEMMQSNEMTEEVAVVELF